jgi:hypothetical protein
VSAGASSTLAETSGSSPTSSALPLPTAATGAGDGSGSDGGGDAAGDGSTTSGTDGATGITADSGESGSTSTQPPTGGGSNGSGSSELVFQDGFESSSWYSGWGQGSSPNNVTLISDGSASQGNSFVRVSVPAGEHYGTSFGYEFDRMGLAEPDQVYFRYAVRFGPTWTTEGGGGGKLPGFGGTYGTAGWGGRPADGTNGWSARGLFWPPESDASRANGDTGVGFYTYHADMTGTYGSNWYWSGGSLDNGAMQRNRWYQVEMYIENNTPGLNDGVLRAWIDGTQVFEKTDIRFRDVERLHVERVWFDIYYGGKWDSPADMYVDFDDVSISVGPMG